jgi:hypothetical protein
MHGQFLDDKKITSYIVKALSSKDLFPIYYNDLLNVGEATMASGSCRWIQHCELR